MSAAAKTVVVTGDVTMDWNLAHRPTGAGAPAGWTADDSARMSWQRGGAALLADLISAVSQSLRSGEPSDISLRQADVPRGSGAADRRVALAGFWPSQSSRVRAWATCRRWGTWHTPTVIARVEEFDRLFTGLLSHADAEGTSSREAAIKALRDYIEKLPDPREPIGTDDPSAADPLANE